MKSKTKTNEDRHLQQVCDKHFPDSADRRWPPPAPGKGWFKAPRTLSVLLQILTEKEVGSTGPGNPGRAYLELLSRAREPGAIVLDHPADHARLIGYTRPRTWVEAMRKLTELGFIETKRSHERDFAYALIVNPFIPVRQLHRQNKIGDDLWNLFHERWSKGGSDIPAEDDDNEPVSAETSSVEHDPTPRKSRAQRGSRTRPATAKL